MKRKALLLLTAAILLLPKINLAQAPVLGTAADFVLFTSVGALSNTGISQLTGNVGSNSGSSTGFGNVNGVMHNNNGTTAAAAADLNLGYNQLNSAIPTFFPAPLLGNGQTLNAGVYSISGASTLNLDLTLDGQGNPNAIFIFQIQGPFSANANAKVKLINDAQACNVFWKVEGLVSLASAVTMRGTIVANNAAINMSTNDTLEGRALSTAGAITIDGTLAYKPIGCGSAVLTGPLAPTLGATACYTLFTSIGPVTNAGVTNVTGDIGSDNGTTTGFNPLLVVGMIHGTPDGSTALAASDLISVYNYLNGLPYDIELLYPAQFGNNLVLTPHTYRMNSAATFTDTLYLNGEGNPNAVFVIQINGALATSTYSKVKLINGTQAKNVFWKVEGAVSINDYSVFRGTIVANNGAISMTTGVYLDGRALTTTGAVNTAAITAIMPPGCGATATSPVISLQPNDQLVCAGDSAGFSVTAVGTGLSYQWRRGTVNLVNGGNISGATSAVLSINPVSAADTAYNYNVIVSGMSSPNDTSDNVSLGITNAIAITSEPMGQTLCPGDSAFFTVMAPGSGLTYQWRKGNVDLINGGNISGATSATLTIDPSSIADTAFNYNVIVTGSCGSDTSVYAFLMITNGVSITSEPMNQISCLGSSVSFATVASGSGLTYQWRKGTVNMVNAGNISGVNTAMLSVNPVTGSDAALNYNVIINGSCVSDTSVNVSLTVDSIRITTEPSNEFVCIGTPASFSAVAAGSGMSYQWRKGAVNMVNGGNISGVNTSVLTINPSTISDIATNYNLIVTGTCGNDTSLNVSLNIDSTRIVSVSPNQSVCLGNSIAFSVNALGSGLTYQWRKGAVNLVNGGNISGATTSVLTINPATILDNATNYNVIVSGSCGNDTSANVTLNVVTAPTATAGSNSPVCTGSAINLTAVTVSGANYSWSGPAGYSSSTQNPVILSASFSDAGNYSLTVSQGGCTSFPSVVAVVVNNCNSDLSVIKSVNTATPFFGTQVTFVITATNNGSGTATGVVVNDVLQNGYVYVSSSVTAGSYDVLTGEWVVGNMIDNSTETLTMTATVVEGGNYVNTAIIYGNESDPDMTNNNSSVETFPTDFFIPEGFSPNGDGINDLFVIRGIRNYPENTFVIFNRWGDKVFEANPYTSEWDGKCGKGLRLGGEQLPIGTYFYILDLGNDTDIIKGTIYLNK
ncbi:MAG: hypothetical protein K0Q95_2796 [Bacteroidota bacterium]|nr:hypothetical protein [Bacteroidota bacterium]